jgi:methyltransferase (TIGR00027 family)
MSEQPDFLPNGVSDTSYWAAHFRALEHERDDALFRDPYARRLAGERGLELAESLKFGNQQEWAWIARTYLFDQFIFRQLGEGAEVVINLAAGLDSRPYRLSLPAQIQWFEIDFPQILSYKERILTGERSTCHLQRTALDVTDIAARRLFFKEVNSLGKKVTVVSEGLLPYLEPQEVQSLAIDLYAYSFFETWIIDLVSAAQLKIMQRSVRKELQTRGVNFKFGPTEGAEFFGPFGWRREASEGFLATAAKLNRAPSELLSLLPEPKGSLVNYPWSGICLLARSDHSLAK